MHRISRKLALLTLACGFVAVTFATPVAGQVDPGAISDLEGRRDEIVSQISDLDAEIAELGGKVDELDTEVDVATVQVELLADELELTVDARRQPARTRVQIAIAGFVGGDPRGSALIDEMEAVQGSDEPSRRRQMYGAVIDDAVSLLAEIDVQLAELTEQMAARRKDLTDVESEVETAQQRLTDAGAERTALAIELDDVRSRIQELRNLANRNVLTGLTTSEDPNRPALAIKIDNLRPARPQAGINEADIVFVEEVEGELTRLVAIFHSTGVEEVGPIRSMRTGDLDLLAQFNSPLFANSGGNRGTRGALATSTLIDVGAHTIPEAYYRERGRPRPHDLMANTYNLWAIGAGLATNSPSPMFSFRDPGSPAGPGARPATTLIIEYGDAQSLYEWNGTGWARSQNGEPMVDTAGVRVAPTTVIVQVTQYGASFADPASPHAYTTGTGVAFVLTEGQVVPAIWRRSELTDQTEYVDNDGNPLSILRGRTWVELARPDTTIID